MCTVIIESEIQFLKHEDIISKVLVKLEITLIVNMMNIFLFECLSLSLAFAYILGC